MATAHDLARYAAAAADYICVDEVKSFSVQNGFDVHCSRVTFVLKNGRRRVYTVTLEEEGDTPDGESLT